MATTALAKPQLCPDERTMLPCRNYCKTHNDGSEGLCLPTKKGDISSPKTCKCYGGSGIAQRDDSGETDQMALDEILTILDGFPILSIDEIDDDNIAERSELEKRKCHMELKGNLFGSMEEVHGLDMTCY
ncbi:hypothetical protein AC579_6226 [Pseudocercospora musae]|uniref:Uncharacterized protein n=1 Tax=Pseudocercospora musae TaxID=113226 RepID=A0A139HTH5_9PEZI|nr:hypothetical protein AC579_6226 [Pseudocercospora musae]